MSVSHTYVSLTHICQSHTHVSLTHICQSHTHMSVSHTCQSHTHMSVSHTYVNLTHICQSHTHMSVSHTYVSLTHICQSHTHMSVSHTYVSLTHIYCSEKIFICRIEEDFISTVGEQKEKFEQHLYCEILAQVDVQIPRRMIQDIDVSPGKIICGTLLLHSVPPPLLPLHTLLTLHTLLPLLLSTPPFTPPFPPPNYQRGWLQNCTLPLFSSEKKLFM